MATANKINSLTDQQAALLLYGLQFITKDIPTTGSEREDITYLTGQLEAVQQYHKESK